MSKFEDALLESGSIMRRGYSLISENSGKLIALITALVAVLLTFAEVGLPSVVGAELGADLIVMLVASYVIYFSLEDAGERLGKSSEAYIDAERLWRERADAIGGEDVIGLRDFCISYSREELAYRRRTALLSAGLSEEDYRLWESGSPTDKRSRRILRRISRMKPIELSPASLLGGAVRGRASELRDPERHKLLRLALGLVPTTLCMLFTVSMMISTKSGLDAATVIGGIVKLSTLPVIAMRGYAQGYDYARLTLPAWLQTRAKLLEAFSASAA